MACWQHRVLMSLAVLLMVSGCGEGPSSQGEGTTISTSATVKRITGAVMSDPATISHSAIGSGGSIPGGDRLEDLVNAGLSIVDVNGASHPQLAETVPSLDNGLWQVAPDGQMSTTWKLKSGV